eukprot:2741561-Rhodomonas_salina.1
MSRTDLEYAATRSPPNVSRGFRREILLCRKGGRSVRGAAAENICGLSVVKCGYDLRNKFRSLRSFIVASSAPRPTEGEIADSFFTLHPSLPLSPARLPRCYGSDRNQPAAMKKFFGLKKDKKEEEPPKQLEIGSPTNFTRSEEPPTRLAFLLLLLLSLLSA